MSHNLLAPADGSQKTGGVEDRCDRTQENDAMDDWAVSRPRMAVAPRGLSGTRQNQHVVNSTEFSLNN